jgi:hypothetical protein
VVNRGTDPVCAALSVLTAPSAGTQVVFSCNPRQKAWLGFR